jgi:hypothetical protein
MGLHLPRLIIPSGGVPVGQARPLQICPSCRYVLSNAGKCENILCSVATGESSGNEASSLKYYNNCSFCSGKKCMGH